MPDNNCLLYSAAMVLDTDPGILIKEIGHDGKRLEWSNLGYPLGQINFHIQEIMDSFIKRGFALVPIELLPVTQPEVPYPIDHCEIWNNFDAEDRFIKHITGRQGILVGRGSNGLGHAVAWNGEHVYDPNGSIYDVDDFEIREAWIQVKMI